MEPRGSGERGAGRPEGQKDAGADGAVGTGTRMRAAIAALTTGGGSQEELEAAARDFMHELRACERSPEAALIRIKSVLAEAGLRPNYPSDDVHRLLEPEARLYRDVIAWSIKAYYE
jgi:hypothetical protein